MDFDKMLPEQMARPPEEPEWSPYQQEIFNATIETDENLSIEAVAGSGKSTTIIKAAALLPAGTSNLFMAFNKSIVNDLSGKLPYSTQCKTMNALGHGLMMRKVKSLGHSPTLNTYLKYDVGRSILSEQEWEEYGTSLVRLVSLAIANAIGIVVPNDAGVYRTMLGDFDVEIPHEHEQKACRQATEFLRRWCAVVTDQWEFDHQLYMPVYWEQTFPQFDTVFVDEAQDLSGIQHIMLERLADRGARIIAVGDSRQAIYGFRGADGASMAKLAEYFDMKLLPLSISYRCPKAVVAEAQKIVHHIEAHEDAPEGEVTHLTEFPEPVDFPGLAMVLCRTNAPLFTLALRFLADKRPCQLKSNFGKGLIKFVKDFDLKTTAELYDALKKWRDKEKLEAESRGWWGKAQLVDDKFNALVPFCDQFELKVQVVAALQQLLTTQAGPVLATIHKAKGLEANDVYILRPDLIPAPFAKHESAIEQEMNLKYVAVTRAKRRLFYLPDEMDS